MKRVKSWRKGKYVVKGIGETSQAQALSFSKRKTKTQLKKSTSKLYIVYSTCCTGHEFKNRQRQPALHLFLLTRHVTIGRTSAYFRTDLASCTKTSKTRHWRTTIQEHGTPEQPRTPKLGLRLAFD